MSSESFALGSMLERRKQRLGKRRAGYCGMATIVVEGADSADVMNMRGMVVGSSQGSLDYLRFLGGEVRI